MQTQYDNLKVSSPAPGHYVIDGLPTGSTQTEEGRLVHPMSVHIPPSLPSGLLMEIVKDRGAALGTVTANGTPEVVEVIGAADTVVVAAGFDDVRLVEDGVKDSESIHDGDTIDNALILATLRNENNGTMRIKELAESSSLSVDRIKGLSGNGFEVGAAGWVKLKEGGEA